MQWKMARPGRLAQRVNRWSIGRGFPALAWIAPRWPRPLLHLGARIVISLVMALNWRPQRTIAANLGRILALPTPSRAVRRARRRMLYHFAYSWVDLFRFAQLPPDRISGLLEHVEGSEHLAASLAAERPVILLTAHLGSWEVGGLFLKAAGFDRPLAVVYVPDAFVAAESYRSLLRGRSAVEEIPLRLDDDLSSLPILRALRAGRLVAVQGDRDFNDRGVDVAFFGRPAPFPTGPFRLAQMSGADLIPVFVAYTPKRSFEVVLHRPIRVPAGGDRTAAVERAVASWVDVLETAIRRWPTQWYTFYDVWAQARRCESAQEPPAAEIA